MFFRTIDIDPDVEEFKGEMDGSLFDTLGESDVVFMPGIFLNFSKKGKRVARGELGEAGFEKSGCVGVDRTGDGVLDIFVAKSCEGNSD